MPDLITHAVSVYPFCKLRHFKRYRLFLLIGVLLPDLLGRPIHILFPRLMPYTLAVHTPVFMIVFILLLAEFFEKGERALVIKFTAAGVLCHFILDMLQRHIGSGYFWFFPFSWKSFEWGLFWPEDSIKWIPLWLILILAAEAVVRIIKGRKIF
ncbi:MAG: zinc dependent phospholipase C family protein [candidate division KSB1 bacterium]|nr:zinc dependent phospholipase C family protein [candidate division KSB1 bacterium]